MAITPGRVREIFKGLENGDGASFFEQVADDVDWTVMGTHPLAGQNLSKKDFIEGTFAKLSDARVPGWATVVAIVPPWIIRQTDRLAEMCGSQRTIGGSIRQIQSQVRQSGILFRRDYRLKFHLERH
jgi:hypothetical protein